MKDKDEKQNSDSFFENPTDYNYVVSNMDCTGLIPTLASDPEVEAYSDIYTIPKPDNQYLEE